MHKYLLYIGFIVLAGCTNDNLENVFDVNSYPQTWQLKSMSLGLSGETIKDDDLPYQQTLVLKPNGDFEKTRIVSDSISKGSGSFLFNESETSTLLVLNYYTETYLIESCSRDKTIETLFLASSYTIFDGSSPCDGPSLDYIRIK